MKDQDDATLLHLHEDEGKEQILNTNVSQVCGKGKTDEGKPERDREEHGRRVLRKPKRSVSRPRSSVSSLWACRGSK